MNTMFVINKTITKIKLFVSWDKHKVDTNLID